MYEDLYKKGDPKSCKVREKMADVFYKAGKIHDAIQELKKVEVFKKIKNE